MRAHRLVPIVGIGLALTLLSGCLWAPDLDRVRLDIEDQLPGTRFEKEIAFSLGPIALTLVKAAVRFLPDTHEARSYLKEIRNVKVAIYKAKNVPSSFDVRIPKELKKLIDGDDWELVVKTREKGEATWILCRTKDEKIQGLYVVVLDHDDLVLVRARGRLDKLFQKAMRENMNLREHAWAPDL